MTFFFFFLLDGHHKEGYLVLSFSPEIGPCKAQSGEEMGSFAFSSNFVQLIFFSSSTCIRLERDREKTTHKTGNYARLQQRPKPKESVTLHPAVPLCCVPMCSGEMPVEQEGCQRARYKENEDRDPDACSKHVSEGPSHKANGERGQLVEICDRAFPPPILGPILFTLFYSKKSDPVQYRVFHTSLPRYNQMREERGSLKNVHG